MVSFSADLVCHVNKARGKAKQRIRDGIASLLYLEHKDINAGVTESKPGPVHLSMNVLPVHSISQYTAETNSVAWLQHEFFSSRVSGCASLSFTLALEIQPLEEKSAMKIIWFFFPQNSWSKYKLFLKPTSHLNVFLLKCTPPNSVQNFLMDKKDHFTSIISQNPRMVWSGSTLYITGLSPKIQFEWQTPNAT